MYFKRDISEKLQVWKRQSRRKPLIIMGARQVGKTSAIKLFGQSAFEDMAYFNFERQPELNGFFESNKEPGRILADLSLFRGQKIDPQKTLIVFDEIQECRDALTALKYFNEDATDYFVIAAGSLLGITLGHSASFPVGQVEFQPIHPLTFEEYLRGTNEKLFETYEHICNQEKIEPIAAAFFNPLEAAFKRYQIAGGMPEVAKLFYQTGSFEKLEDSQQQILDAYSLDFAKHITASNSIKVNYIWNSIPSQLAKKNKKFLYKVVKTGARAREYENALSWLDQAGLINKVYRVSKPSIPLTAFEDITAFKIYLLDVGLLARMARVNSQSYFKEDLFMSEFRGALAENYIAQVLKSKQNHSSNYWTSEGTAEVDFLIEQQGKIIPIEVKSGQSTKSKSLASYKNKYQPDLRLRFSIHNLSQDDDLINIPFFLADKYPVLISKALNCLK